MTNTYPFDANRSSEALVAATLGWPKMRFLYQNRGTEY